GSPGTTIGRACPPWRRNMWRSSRRPSCSRSTSSAGGRARRRSSSTTAGSSTRSTSRAAGERHGCAALAAIGAAGVRAHARPHADLPLPAGADPARGSVLQVRLARRQRVLRLGAVAARARRLSPLVRRVVRGGGGERGVRPDRRLGARPLRVPGPPPRRRTRRPPVRAAYRGRGHHAHDTAREERLDRPAARAARHLRRLHAARRHRGAHVHRPAFRRAHGAARARRPRARARGGGGEPRRRAREHVRARAVPHALARARHRLRARVRALGRRIRVGGVHLGQSADAHGDRAALDRDRARAVQLCRGDRDRGGAARDLVRAAAGDQRAAALGPAPARGSRVMPRVATRDPRWVRALLIGTALLFLGLFLVLPLVTVFVQALSKGLAVYADAIREPTALAAIRLTLLVAAVSVPANAIFGIAAAWAIAKFEFRGKALLITAIDLPFAVS